MNILICGASGFVGRHLDRVLSDSGYNVFRGVRNPGKPNDIAIDYCHDLSKSAWFPKLEGMDVVVNAVGVLRNSGKQPMKLLHEKAPIALFSACREVGIKKVIQISALGIDQNIETTYFQTKRQADITLQEIAGDMKYLIIQSSLIYGCDGTSAKMFRSMARFPVHFMIGDDQQRLRPVHIDDLVIAIKRWIDDEDAFSQTLAAVGLDETNFSGMLASYRKQMGLVPAKQFSIPVATMSAIAKIGDLINISPLCSETLAMLLAGNTADIENFSQLLGGRPRSFHTFID